MKEDCDYETWVIELGADIIRKEHESGTSNLSNVEKAVYDLLAVDYAVKNAGDMEALEDLRPSAAIDLAAFLRTIEQFDLATYMDQLATAGEDCESYYEKFAALCQAIQKSQSGT